MNEQHESLDALLIAAIRHADGGEIGRAYEAVAQGQRILEDLMHADFCAALAAGKQSSDWKPIIEMIDDVHAYVVDRTPRYVELYDVRHLTIPNRIIRVASRCRESRGRRSRSTARRAAATAAAGGSEPPPSPDGPTGAVR